MDKQVDGGITLPMDGQCLSCASLKAENASLKAKSLQEQAEIAALDSALTALKGDYERLEEKNAKLTEELAAYPADWLTDSSLKTWFPLTAEEVEKLKAEIQKLRAVHASELGVCEQHCEVVKKLREAMPPATNLRALANVLEECDFKRLPEELRSWASRIEALKGEKG
jgi:chromosome segregation ATPase